MSTAEILRSEYDDKASEEYERRRAKGGIALQYTVNSKVVQLHRNPDGEGNDIFAVSTGSEGDGDPRFYEVGNLNRGYTAFDQERAKLESSAPEQPPA